MIPNSTAPDKPNGTLRPSQPLKLMDLPLREQDGSSDQDPSSGASSGGTPTTILPPKPRYGFLCFRKRCPHTLVDGRYRKHDPGSLPEPLKWGFFQWAQQQKGRGKPLDEAENLYNNRTLRFWRLSTDYGRFMKHEDEAVRGGIEDAEDDDDAVYEVVNGVPQRHTPTTKPALLVPSSVFWTSPQRPYTAPPHQMNRPPC